MSYKINGVEYETHSATNQKIIDHLVEREVYCCLTPEVEYMLERVYEGDKNNPLDINDLESLYVTRCSECGDLDFEEMSSEELSDEEIINLSEESAKGKYTCPVCGESHKSVDEARNCCASESVYKCCSCGTIYNRYDYDNLTEFPEIYEWWAVSKWFGEKLREQGCVVIEQYGKSLWGRETTGQAISLDGCIINIAKKMGILEGMENDWSKYI